MRTESKSGYAIGSFVTKSTTNSGYVDMATGNIPGHIMAKKLHVLFLLLLLAHACPCLAESGQTQDPGVRIYSYALPTSLGEETQEITILKIDPEYYDFKLLTTSRSKKTLSTLKEWCEQEGLVAAINASMYREDREQSTGYMKICDHVNNGYINPRFGAFLVFHPTNSTLPKIQIIDRVYQDWRHLITHYTTVAQNFRLISIKKENLWPISDKKHSIAAIGMDIQGHVLFMHCQTPISVHAFNEALLNLPIDIFNAMYVEGGPEAAMYLHTPNQEKIWPGRYENSLLGTVNQKLWPIPNIIGIVPHKTTSEHDKTENKGDLPCK